MPPPLPPPPPTGTSPLYAYQAVFTAAPGQQEVLNAASLFFWTLTLIVLVKYVGIVLRFDDNGEGEWPPAAPAGAGRLGSPG